MTTLHSITEVDLTHQRVLIREDFNVPILHNRILNDRRIRAALPTIEYALEQKAAVILISHWGRPTPDASITDFSLEPVAKYLSSYLKQPVRLVQDWVTGIQIEPGEVVLCENVRLQPGEQTNDPHFSKKIAQLADIIVMDAFAVSHRVAASTVGMIQYAKKTCAGLLLISELENLSLLENPEPPFVALIGGAKVSSKLRLLEKLIPKLDHLLIGGIVANAFLVAQCGKNIDALDDSHEVKAAKRLLELSHAYPCTVHLPQDVIIKTVEQKSLMTIMTKEVSDIQPCEYKKIGDIGPLTIAHYTQILQRANTIFWNGPMGHFEKPEFQQGTQAITQAVAGSSAFSVAGGGETLTAIDQWQLYPTCLSTGGGALLAFLTGEPLPAIEALIKRQNILSTP